MPGFSEGRTLKKVSPCLLHNRNRPAKPNQLLERGSRLARALRTVSGHSATLDALGDDSASRTPHPADLLATFVPVTNLPTLVLAAQVLL